MGKLTIESLKKHELIPLRRLVKCNPLAKPWAPCQIRKIAGCACAGNAGNVFSRHRGLAIPTCITARAWCMPGSLTSSFIWSWWRGKRSRHSRRMRNPQFDVPGKRPMAVQLIKGSGLESSEAWRCHDMKALSTLLWEELSPVCSPDKEPVIRAWYFLVASLKKLFN